MQLVDELIAPMIDMNFTVGKIFAVELCFECLSLMCFANLNCGGIDTFAEWEWIVFQNPIIVCSGQRSRKTDYTEHVF